jgi:histidyl-tRNA synthetase
VTAETAEIELILATPEALTALQLEDLTVRINDRRLLTAMARWCGFADDRHDSVFITLDKWDKLSRDEIADELRRTGHPEPAIARMVELFSGFEEQKSLKWLTQQIPDAGDGDGIGPLRRILEAASPAAVARIEFDATLVRGMSYYTGPIFEITSSRFPSSIAGGGRYDRMIGRILGQDVPATGFSIGFERVVSILQERAAGGAGRTRRVALLVEEAAPDLRPVLERARALRAEGHLVSLEIRRPGRNWKPQTLAGQGFDGFAEGPEGAVRWFETGRGR